MTALEDALDDYLTLRRAVGYKLGRPGQLLAQFVGYLDGAGAATVTVEHAVAWATQPAGADPSWWAYRLDAVRGFALYLHTSTPPFRRCHATCCPTDHGARRPTCTPTMSSPRCSRPRAAWRTHCAPTPARR